MRSLIVVLCAAALVSCATKQTPAPGAGPKMEQQQIKNISQFDLASCFSKEWTLPSPANRESIIGFLVAQRPGVLECLVDPKTRGPEKLTKVIVDTNVTEAGVDTKVTGENLLPPGVACVKNLLDKTVGLKPQPKGAPPATGHAEFIHTAGVSPTVTFGINEASDQVGLLRLAEQTWCDCFADWKDSAPYKLVAKIEINKGPAAAGGAADAGVAAAPTVTVNFDPGSAPAADKVAACLKPKMQSVAYNSKSEILRLIYPFITLNTSVADDLPDALDDVKFLQLDGARAQRSAETALALSVQKTTVDTWNALVKKYKERPSSVPVTELKRRCAALLKADDALAASVDSQLGLEKRTADLAAKLKEANPSDTAWADTATTAQNSAQELEKYLATIKTSRAGDAQGCPKEKY